ncbi:hypothetical protein K466DRAFT_616243, partial [Polyporus arcularius HHB13444]
MASKMSRMSRRMSKGSMHSAHSDAPPVPTPAERPSIDSNRDRKGSKGKIPSRLAEMTTQADMDVQADGDGDEDASRMERQLCMYVTESAEYIFVRATPAASSLVGWLTLDLPERSSGSHLHDWHPPNYNIGSGFTRANTVSCEQSDERKVRIQTLVSDDSDPLRRLRLDLVSRYQGHVPSSSDREMAAPGRVEPRAEHGVSQTFNLTVEVHFFMRSAMERAEPSRNDMPLALGMAPGETATADVLVSADELPGSAESDRGAERSRMQDYPEKRLQERSAAPPSAPGAKGCGVHPAACRCPAAVVESFMSRDLESQPRSIDKRREITGALRRRHSTQVWRRFKPALRASQAAR